MTGLNMVTTVVGLTGSIGTGKSTVAAMLKRLKIPVQEADAVVHDLFQNDDEVITRIAKMFPSVVHHHKIDKRVLGQIVFQDPLQLYQLENLLHPLVRQRHFDFISRHRYLNTPLIVLDIPLLFEINWQGFCDKVVVTTCQTDAQFERVLRRPGMNTQYLQNIIAKQWPSIQKCARADYVIDTNRRKLDTYQQLRKILEGCMNF